MGRAPLVGALGRIVLPRVVLDTNAVRALDASVASKLTADGRLLSISEVALIELWAASVRSLADGASRARARGLLQVPIRRLNKFVDPIYPVAVVRTPALQRVEHQVGGPPPSKEVTDYVAMRTAEWRLVASGAWNDEEWIAQGRIYQRWLDDIEGQFAKLARRSDQASREDAPVDGGERRKRYEALTKDERRDAYLAFAREAVPVSPAAEERVDLWHRFLGQRLFEAAQGSRSPKDNDGADSMTLIHVAEGAVLVANDRKMVDVVDECGSFQGAWVRRFDQLDDLPDVQPWGPAARALSHVFARKRKLVP